MAFNMLVPTLCLVALVLSALPYTHALYKDEAGKLDWILQSSGHGRTVFAQAVGNVLVTSDSNGSGTLTDHPTSCYVAARSLQDGSLLWRRNVCSSGSTAMSHQTAVSSSVVTTLDSKGVVRAWTLNDGTLLWDKELKGGNKAALWTVDDYIVVAFGSDLTVLDAQTGKEADASVARDSRPKESNPLEAYCDKAQLAVTMTADGSFAQAWQSDNGKPSSKEIEILAAFAEHYWEEDRVERFLPLSCEGDSFTVLVSTQRGTTAVVTFSEKGEMSVKLEVLWSAEEGLADVSSALLLDASHHFVGDEQEAKEEKLLEFSSRLESQWKEAVSALTPKSASNRRNQLFGFVKTAVLLSQSSNRIYGMDTIGDNRGTVRYVIDLPVNAEWHKMIHGSANSRKASGGMGGTTHAREVLVVSYVNKEVQWMCLDGTNGDVHTQGSVAVSSPISQIMPLVGTGACRQSALMLLEDRSLITVPNDEETKLSVVNHVTARDNSFFTHIVDKKTSGLESFRISAAGDKQGLVSNSIGHTAFPGERIVAVGYPLRDEAVKSPCNVLGDNSLLLKYLNPHLVVLMTFRDDSDNDDGNKLSAALRKNKKTFKKRKPAGADPQASGVVEVEPNLFVNVMDSVSGRILYRASHADALPEPAPTVVISENWIVYTFQNERTRRTEVGVLSLYEGMVSSTALTAFSTPEQTTSFSGLDARESKPVVLAKTYGMAQSVTAVGVTSTRSGISSHRWIFAGRDGRINMIDKKALEPRRPVGDVKDYEKKEGLHQYSELIPDVPLSALTYDLTVGSVKHILTSPTNLESQSLVLAYGGPDIFFTRTSPSRGFDLLPESFNRTLLSIVVLALLVILLIVKRMGAKKIQKQGWV